MRTFYKKHQRLINIFLGSLFIVVNFIFANSYRNRGLEEEALIQQKRVHSHFAKAISHNLETDCDLFDNRRFMSVIEHKLDQFGFELNLAKERIISINRLFYDRITYRTFEKGNAKNEVVSHGYLVTHEKSLKCFGIL